MHVIYVTIALTVDLLPKQEIFFLYALIFSRQMSDSQLIRLVRSENEIK